MILDHRGNPIKKSSVQEEPQTAKVGTLHSEFATHPSRGLTPGRLAGILQQAERGDLIAQCDLAEDIEEKDGHVYAELAKRKRAISGLPWSIEPPKNASAAEEKQAEQIAEWFEELCIEDIILDMADAILKGWSCQEMEWEFNQGVWIPKAIEFRQTNWFTVPDHDRNDLRLRDNSADGEPLRPLTWIVHKHKAKSGYVTRSGLVRQLAWPFVFKNYSVRDLAEFLEIYGLPLRLGKYPPGANDTEKMTLLRAVLAIGHNAGGIIPQGMDIEFEDAAQGNPDSFKVMIDHCERTQSKVIVGGTLTSQADGASSTNALGNVHNEVRIDLRDADALQIAKTIKHNLIGALSFLNFGIVDRRRLACLVFDTQEPEDLALYSEALPKLVGVGLRIGTDHAYNKLRIPKPEDDEEVLQSAAPAVVPPTENEAEALAALRAHDDAHTDELDALAETMAGDWERVATPLIQPILDLKDRVNSYEEFNAELPAVLSQMDDSDIAELMAQGNFGAALFGRVSDD